METNKIIQGDALIELKKLPEKSINMCMTSPPYWALRDYGEQTSNIIWDETKKCEHSFEIEERRLHGGSMKEDYGCSRGTREMTDWKTKDGFCSKCGAWKGQLGLEPTFDLYIKHLCDIFDEVKRVLRDDGVCYVNIGDTYYTKSGTNFENDNLQNKSKEEVSNTTGINKANQLRGKPHDYMQEKSLVGIPFRFALEMINRGWILRNVIIWHKPNCMPSSVKDRFTVDFEYIFFFVKSKKYWFETQYEPLAEVSMNDKRRDKGRFEYNGKRNNQDIKIQNAMCGINSKGRNKRAVWRICPKPFKEAHFAVFPEELCETPIKSGCPEFVCNKCGKAREIEEIKIGTKNVPPIGGIKHLENGNPTYSGNTEQNIYETKLSDCNCNAGFSGGIVLDPFFGAGTTGLVALKQNKQFIGIELNPKYIEIAENRLKPFLEQEKLL